MQLASKKALEVLSEKVENIFDIRLNFSLKFDLIGVSTIGQCKKINKDSYLIRLHEPLLEYYRTIYIDDVLTHEVAHAVQMKLYNHKVKPHGIEWIDIMEKLENRIYQPKMRPKYKKIREITKSKKYKLYAYTCKCKKTHYLTSIRHNRVKKGTIYLCKYCKNSLIIK